MKAETIIPLLIYDMTLDKSFYFCFFIDKIGTKNTFSEGIHVNGYHNLRREMRAPREGSVVGVGYPLHTGRLIN